MALVLAPEPPVADWLEALDAQIGRSPAFFEGRPVVLDLGALPSEQPDVAGLLQRLHGRGIRIIGTEGAHPSWQGLEPWAPLHANGTRPARAIDVPDERRPAEAPATSSQDVNSLLIDQPVRSGQSIVFEKGDVTIVGSVASGAEVIAGGSIHVYGALRGRAIAGLTGNNHARIFCRRLEAELLAIDGVYQTADDMGAPLRGRAVQAWLAGEAMMLAALD
jgi:septum site-determining protein MinC